MPGSRVRKHNPEPKPEELRKPVLRISIGQRKFENAAMKMGFSSAATKILIEKAGIEGAKEFVKRYGPKLKKLAETEDALMKRLQNFAMARGIKLMHLPEKEARMKVAKFLIKGGIGIGSFMNCLEMQKGMEVKSVEDFKELLVSALNSARRGKGKPAQGRTPEGAEKNTII